METDQESQSVPEPHEFARRFVGKKQLDLPPVPEDDDLNATVIEVMTDIEVLLDGKFSDRRLCFELCATKTCGSQ